MGTKLNYQTNEEKGKILHKEFYSEMPAFINYLSNFSTYILENQSKFATTWNNGLFTFDLWLSIITDIADRLKENPDKIAASRAKFSWELFGDLRALFTIHCLVLYVNDKDQHPDEKFREKVKTMFKTE